MARLRLRQISKERFGGNVSELARAMRVTQSTASEFLTGNRGAGTKLIQGMARIDPSLALTTIGIEVRLPEVHPFAGGAVDSLLEEGAPPDLASRAVGAASSLLGQNCTEQQLLDAARFLLAFIRGLEPATEGAETPTRQPRRR
jgi:transcriptional regulator with XRE-family HTH domain